MSSEHTDKNGLWETTATHKIWVVIEYEKTKRQGDGERQGSGAGAGETEDKSVGARIGARASCTGAATSLCVLYCLPLTRN